LGDPEAVVKRFAARARVAQQSSDWEWVPDQVSVQGRRVVVSTDGGGLRIRKKKRGPATGIADTKRIGVNPSCLLSYIANDEGRQERSFCPFLDGTLAGPDAVFGMIAYYLDKLKVSAADQVLFVADGARRFRDRVKPLLAALGLKASQLFELIDFYHAVEHLSAFARLKPRW
jgi:hypothetical protein